MKRWFAIVLTLALAAISADHLIAAESEVPVLYDNLLRSQLARVDSTEVTVSHITAGSGAVFPGHHHPGEEFIYVIEGSGTLQLQGDPPVTLKAGDAFKVPLERVHSATVGDRGMKAIVFRVHPMGQPERVLTQ